MTIEKLRLNPFENLIASAQEGCLPDGFSSFYLGTDFRERENIIDVLFNEYLRRDPAAKAEIQRFIRIVDYVFPKKRNLQEHTFIKKALKIATVAHQYNRIEKRRMRKSDQTPYIFHPMVMAEFQLRSKLDAFTIAASLLHDVPEDADLGKGLNKASDWLALIRDEFNFTTYNVSIFGIEKNRKAGDLLGELVEGATEKPVPKDRDELRNLRTSPFHKMLTAYVKEKGIRVGRRRGRFPPPTEKILSQEDLEVIDEVAYNLKELFDKALQSPDHWRIFFIKIADVWQNLQTPEWIKQAKILRGRVAAGLAEWLGWFEVRSDLVLMLAPITNMLTPYKPMADPDKEPFPRDYQEIERLPRYLPYIEEKLEEFSQNPRLQYYSVVGWPIVYTDKPYNLGVNESSLPLPEIILLLEKEDFEVIAASLPRTKDEYNILTDFWGQLPSDTPSEKESTHYKPYLSEIAQIKEKVFGRLRLDYSVLIRNKISFLLRLESNQPYIRNIFEKEGNVTVDQVPETALFNNYLREKNPTAWDFHLTSLIAFLYEPNLPANLGENVYLLKEGNKILFVDGQISCGSILTLLEKEIAGRETITFRNAYMNEVQVSPEEPFGRTQLGGRRRQISARIVFVTRD